MLTCCIFDGLNRLPVEAIPLRIFVLCLCGAASPSSRPRSHDEHSFGHWNDLLLHPKSQVPLPADNRFPHQPLMEKGFLVLQYVRLPDLDWTHVDWFESSVLNGSR